MTERPADRCAYLRPFPDNFCACPAYMPSRFVALDTGYRALPPVWTCSQLDSATVTSRRSRFYARCRVGDRAAREAWAVLQRGRLPAIRALGEELNPVMADLVTEMWAVKAQQLRSDAGSAAWEEATRSLEELGRRFLATLDSFLDERADRMEALGFPIEACRRLFADLVQRWIAQPNAEAPVIPDSALEAFPPETRVFFKPDYGAVAS